MTIEKKLLGTNPVDGAVTVEDVFSTYLYKGTGAAQTITNGIDLDGEGGMVWLKSRTEGGSKYTGEHHVYDTERGATKALFPNASTSGSDRAQGVKAFNSNGVTIGTNSAINYNNDNFVAWTFRKKEKFFDVVTYSGNGVTGRALSHNLGAAPAMVMIKCISSGGDWLVWHKNGGGGGVTQTTFYLNTSAAGVGTNYIFYGGTGALTDTTFGGLGPYDYSNESGKTYVAYLFADNTAEDADEQMIKCGSYTGNGSANGPVIDLGWEPQYLIVKSASHSDQWVVVDSMRGIVDGGADARLFPNLNNAEDPYDFTSVQAEGFKITTTAGNYNTNGGTYIYMAIRAPMMKKPSAGTEVFAIDTAGSTGDGVAPAHRSGFPVDFGMRPETSGGSFPSSARLTQGRSINTNSSAAEGANGSFKFDYMNGWISDTSTVSVRIAYMWKRAKGYFDVVAYSGNGTAGRTLTHSLGVVPEMIWTKNRTTNGTHWAVYHKGYNGGSSPQNYYTTLNNASGEATDSDLWNNTAPSSTLFTVGANEKVNTNSANFIGYLFATLAGISKVGSYTGNGSSQTINCGFSAGARFILIKRTDASGDWYVWDTTRGIVAGNDPHLSLNTTAAQVTNDDSVDPDNSGFIVNQVAATNINVSSGTYIYLAIAQDYQL